MTPQQKKIILYVGGTLTLLLLVIFGISRFFGSSSKTATSTPPAGLGSFPSGNTVSTRQIPGSSTPNEGGATEEEEPSLEIVYGEPIVSFAVIDRVSTSSGAVPKPLAPTIRFIEQKTGNVYEMDMDWKHRQSSLTRLSNTTIPGIQRSLWSKSGDVALIQYLDENGTVRNALLTFPKADPKNMRIQFIEGSFADIALSPDGTQSFLLEYSSVDGGDGVRGYVASIPGGARREVFSSALTDLRASWGGSSIYVYEKPGAPLSGGALYKINPKTGASVLVSASQEVFAARGAEGYALTDEGGALAVYDEKKDTSSALTLSGFAEKCDFLKALIYCAVPDVTPDRETWYSGGVFTNDGIAISDTAGNTLSMYTPSIDGSHDFGSVRMSSRGDFFAIDRETSLLWRFSLPRPK